MKQKKMILSSLVLTSLMGSASFAAGVDMSGDILDRPALAGYTPLRASELNDGNLNQLTNMLSTSSKPAELKLDGTQLTDIGARAFADYIKSSGIGMSVKEISFRDNAGVTAEGIAALKSACGGMYPITLITDADDATLTAASKAFLQGRIEAGEILDFDLVTGEITGMDGSLYSLEEAKTWGGHWSGHLNQ